MNDQFILEEPEVSSTLNSETLPGVYIAADLSRIISVIESTITEIKEELDILKSHDEEGYKGEMKRSERDELRPVAAINAAKSINKKTAELVILENRLHLLKNLQHITCAKCKCKIEAIRLCANPIANICISCAKPEHAKS